MRAPQRPPQRRSQTERCCGDENDSKRAWPDSSARSNQDLVFEKRIPPQKQKRAEGPLIQTPRIKAHRINNLTKVLPPYRAEILLRRKDEVQVILQVIYN